MTRWQAALAFVALSVLAGCGGAARWTPAWTERWSPPEGERFCAIENARSDGLGGAYFETWSPSRSEVSATGRAYQRSSRHVTAAGVVAAGRSTTVEPSDADLRQLADAAIELSGDAGVVIVQTGRGEDAGVRVADRNGKLIWKRAFQHVVNVSDAVLDDEGELWVAGNFMRVLRVGDVQVPVGAPHPGKIIVPSFGMDVAVDGLTMSPDRVRDGFVLRFDAGGELRLLKRFHSGMVFDAASLAPAGRGVVLVASITGSVPDEIRAASNGAVDGAGATKVTMLLEVDGDGRIAWAQPIGGPSYAQRLVRVRDGFITFLGKEGRVCELTKWVQGA